MGKYGAIDFDEDEIDAAGHWYHDLYLAEHGAPTTGYPGSMLYEITNRGALVAGVADKIRRAKRLEKEAQDAARVATAQAKKATGDEKKELLADVRGLRSIARKARQLVLSETAKPRVHATKKPEIATKASGAWDWEHVAAISSDWFTDAGGAASDLADDLERKFGVERMIEGSQYPNHRVFVKADKRTLEKIRPYVMKWLAGHSATRRSHATKKSPAQLQREIDEVLAGGGTASTSSAAEGFSSSDLQGTVAFRGRSVAVRSSRGWTPIESGSADVGRAVREAIFSMPNDVSASELRREIVSRL